MHASNTLLLAIPALALFASFVWAAPLSNEDLLALRSAERIAERNSATRSSWASTRLDEAFRLMEPVLERPLPAEREVWVSFGRWAEAARDPAAGAVVLAGLRRDFPHFMLDETLADMAVRLNADTRTRDLAARAAERLEAGDSPAEGYRRVAALRAWHDLAATAGLFEFADPASEAATWGALAFAFERAGVPDLAEDARGRADRRRRQIEEPARAARAAVETIEGRILLGARQEDAAEPLGRVLERVRGLPPGAARDRLVVHVAVLHARAFLTDEALRLAASLPPERAAEVLVEVVRSLAREGELADAEAVAEKITDRRWADLADVAIVSELARAGNLAEAEERALGIADPIASAEAQAMILARTEDVSFDPGAWRETLLKAGESERRTLAIARLLGVYGDLLGNDLSRILQRAMFEDESLALIAVRESFAAGAETKPMIVQMRHGPNGDLNRYDALSRAAATLRAFPPE